MNGGGTKPLVIDFINYILLINNNQIIMMYSQNKRNLLAKINK